MAEFCLECFNKMNNSDYLESEVVLTTWLEQCEMCGELKFTVTNIKVDKKLDPTAYFFYKLFVNLDKLKLKEPQRRSKRFMREQKARAKLERQLQKDLQQKEK